VVVEVALVPEAAIAVDVAVDADEVGIKVQFLLGTAYEQLQADEVAPVTLARRRVIFLCTVSKQQELTIITGMAASVRLRTVLHCH
jgi:hypothetical protein